MECRFKYDYGHHYRGVAQLIERGIWDAEAAGLSPVTPTKSPIGAAVRTRWL